MKNHTKSGKTKYQKGFWGAVFLLLLFLNPMISYAGDIPETLLLKDYPVYFGEVKSIDGDTITIIQIENIKGKFQENSEITYTDYIFTDSPNVGQIYLCGYIDENNPLYIWEVDCYDTATLKITNTDNMSKRMQEYLNSGAFDEAEEKLTAEQEQEETDTTMETIQDNDNPAEDAKITYSFSTHSADGPTAYFMAFKTKDLSIFIGTCVLLLAALGILFWRWRIRKKK